MYIYWHLYICLILKSLRPLSYLALFSLSLSFSISAPHTLLGQNPMFTNISTLPPEDDHPPMTPPRSCPPLWSSYFYFSFCGLHTSISLFSLVFILLLLFSYRDSVCLFLSLSWYYLYTCIDRMYTYIIHTHTYTRSLIVSPSRLVCSRCVFSVCVVIKKGEESLSVSWNSWHHSVEAIFHAVCPNEKDPEKFKISTSQILCWHIRKQSMDNSDFSEKGETQTAREKERETGHCRIFPYICIHDLSFSVFIHVLWQVTTQTLTKS